MLGNLGFTEILVLGAIVLLIFGPKRLPELAKGLGKGIREFKKALSQPDEESSEKQALLKNDEKNPDKDSHS
ncbi:twin-arginine translocase TatA/TatE family subunit [bacterium]|nr:twin-arginine translocase TatA/TatE family subunit [bacterium]NBX81508.1 twin-arginine translocase TatA/TatE family subunit [bacterium]